VVFAEDDTQVAKLREHRAELPSVHKVVVTEGSADTDDDPWVISLDALQQQGAALLAEQARRRRPARRCH
jgi:long-chain acyl-CoA synthetase